MVEIKNADFTVVADSEDAQIIVKMHTLRRLSDDDIKIIIEALLNFRNPRAIKLGEMIAMATGVIDLNAYREAKKAESQVAMERLQKAQTPPIGFPPPDSNPLGEAKLIPAAEAALRTGTLPDVTKFRKQAEGGDEGDNEHAGICSYCDGTGQIVKSSVKGDTSEEQTCTYCRGTGRPSLAPRPQPRKKPVPPPNRLIKEGEGKPRRGS